MVITYERSRIRKLTQLESYLDWCLWWVFSLGRGERCAVTILRFARDDDDSDDVIDVLGVTTLSVPVGRIRVV